MGEATAALTSVAIRERPGTPEQSMGWNSRAVRYRRPVRPATRGCGILSLRPFVSLRRSGMNLPFTEHQFFEVFAAYNLAVWPAQFPLTVLAIVLAVLVIRAPERAGRAVAFGLALLWCWLALAYHLAFFWSINPAAPWFAGLSLAAGAAFAWMGAVRGCLRFERGMPARKLAGLLVVVWALAIYPAIGAAVGTRYPAAPTFGLPCPTTIFTFGMLLMAAPPLPKAVVLAPLVWAIIGSAAAFALGVIQDLSLVVMAALGLYLLLRAPASTGRPSRP